MILLEDFECFAPQVVQHLVEIVGEYARSGMPLVFVFGIALASDVIHRLVSRSTTRQLHMRDFRLPAPTASLDALFSRVVMSSKRNQASVLGPRVLAHLLASFEDGTMSVSLFQHAIEVCLMEHAMRHLDGPLLSSPEGLANADLDAVRQLGSVAKAKAVSLEEAELRERIQGWRHEFEDRRLAVVVLWSVVLDLLADQQTDEICAQEVSPVPPVPPNLPLSHSGSKRLFRAPDFG